MHKLILTLLCVFSAGHGQKVRIAAKTETGSSFAECCRMLGAEYCASGLQRISANDSLNSLRRLMTSLLTSNPASVSYCAPTSSRCFFCLSRMHPRCPHDLVMSAASDDEQGTAELKWGWPELTGTSELQSSMTNVEDSEMIQFVKSLQRIIGPTMVAASVGFFFFDEVALFIRSNLGDEDVRFLFNDDAQYIQNFLNADALLFAILAGDAYSALYTQQKQIYFALYQEVSEAKSLFEQITLVCQNRPFYIEALYCLRSYIKNDLQCLTVTPSLLLSAKPQQDPLESIMYMTSVGVPSAVYDTVKGVRQARGQRLAAMQRKFPILGIGLLYVLAFTLLLAFPILGATTAQKSKDVLNYQPFLFAFLTGGIELVLRIILELWRSSGGVFNVDAVLQKMVFGLSEELEIRTRQALLLNPSAAAMAEEVRRESALAEEQELL